MDLRFVLEDDLEVFLEEQEALTGFEVEEGEDGDEEEEEAANLVVVLVAIVDRYELWWRRCFGSVLKCKHSRMIVD